MALYDKTWATHSSMSAVASTLRRAAACQKDEEHAARRKLHKCTNCFYLRAGKLVMHAFTEWQCSACQMRGMHPNSGVPRLCVGCAVENEACVDCGADIELRPTMTVQGGV